jgi:hypothetical protein
MRFVALAETGSSPIIIRMGKDTAEPADAAGAHSADTRESARERALSALAGFRTSQRRLKLPAPSKQMGLVALNFSAIG